MSRSYLKRFVELKCAGDVLNAAARNNFIERVVMTFEQAIALLPEGDHIHTFRSSPGVLIGADWDRENLLLHMQKYPPELSGPAATAMHHGMVLIDENGPLFIATMHPKE